MRAALAVIATSALALAACAPNPEVFDRLATPEPPAQSPTETASASTESTPSSPATSASAAAGRECRDAAADLTLQEQVGQLFMVGVSTAGLDQTTRSAISNGRIGSVVLLENSTDGSAPIRRLAAELGSLGTAKAPLLVAVDQEGGSVQRLKGEGFSEMPPAREQGQMADGELREAAASWGEELRSAGVHYNLAPVADVVPEHKRGSNAPIGQLKREYGSDAESAARSVVEFVEGMEEAGVATSLKHFPGLGEVETNTDFGAAEDADSEADGPGIRPFTAGIEAGADSVMVSSAVFTKIDPDNEGVFSSKVIGDLLRGELGFDGVVIADDLGAAKSVRDIAPADRALRFIDAGGDLLINADPKIMGEMVEATLEKAESDGAFAERLLDSTGRVLRLKASVGLVDCQ